MHFVGPGQYHLAAGLKATHPPATARWYWPGPSSITEFQDASMQDLGLNAALERANLGEAQ